MQITREQSIELNAWIQDWVDDGDKGFDPHDTGKQLAYIGWYWRTVDFTKPFQLGRCLAKGVSIDNIQIEGPADFVGFMENNKWDYPEITVTSEFHEMFTHKLLEIMKNHKQTGKLSLDSLRELDDLLQSQKVLFT